MTKPKDKNLILKLIPLPRNAALALHHEAVDNETNFTAYTRNILVELAKKSKYYKEQ